jgi:hypothetical protein
MAPSAHSLDRPGTKEEKEQDAGIRPVGRIEAFARARLRRLTQTS